MNLTCPQMRLLYFAALAAAGGGVAYAISKKPYIGLGGAGVACVAAFLMLDTCGPGTTGPTLTQTSTPDGTKTTTTVGAATSKAGASKVGLLAGKTVAVSSPSAPSLFSQLTASMRDPSLPVQPVRTVSSLLSGAGAKCSPGWTWSDSRGGCVYQTNVK